MKDFDEKKAYTFNNHGFNKYGIHKTTGEKLDTYKRPMEFYCQYFDLGTGICFLTGTPFDPEGYDIDDLDVNGFDRRGFWSHSKSMLDPDGFHVDGYNRFGFNRKGIHKNGTRFDKDGFDSEGYNKKGFDLRGFDRQGIHKKTGTRFNRTGYDVNGYDAEGFNTHGFNREGIHRNTTRFGYDGRDIYGFDRNGVHKNGTLVDGKGFNAEGYNTNGFDRNGIHRSTGTIYDEEGYDEKGLNSGGYFRSGYNIDGIDEFGFNRRGIHIGETSRTGETRYIDGEGYNSRGFSIYTGKNRLTGEIDQIYLILTSYLDENASPIASVFSRESGFSEADIRYAFKKAERFYPNLDGKIKEKTEEAGRIIFHQVLEDINAVIEKKMTVVEFWNNHQRLTLRDIFQMYKDGKLMLRFSFRIIDYACSGVDTKDLIFALCGKKFDLRQAMRNTDMIKMRINRIEVVNQCDKSTKMIGAKKCSNIWKKLYRLHANDWYIFTGQRVISDGKEVVYSKELIEKTIADLKEEGEYVCTYTILNRINANALANS